MLLLYSLKVVTVLLSALCTACLVTYRRVYKLLSQVLRLLRKNTEKGTDGFPNKITAFKPLLAYPKKLLSAVSNRCGNITTQGSLLGL